ncbi:MAG: DUF3108 domain-containing protein [Nitrospirae bacterium]|nr:DUF3108 domain-containing protein [Nitrospirota bacterium]
MKKIVYHLLIPLALSIILHSILIAFVSGLRLLDLGSVMAGAPITAFLVSEKVSSPPAQRAKPISRPAPAAKATEPLPPNERAVAEKEEKKENASTAQDKTVSDISADTSVQPPLPQENIAVNAPQPEVPALPAQPLPEKKTSLLKKKREKLLFSLYWLDIYVGSAELEASSHDDRITIKSQVHSAPFISLFYKVEDHAESTVVDGAASKFRIKQREGKYRSDKETVFDPERKQVTFFNYLKGTTDEHNLNTPEVWDLISGFYYLRTQPFEVGKTIYIDVFDSNKFFRTEVSVLGKERIKLSDTKAVDTVKVRPVILSEGLFQKSGDVLIWLTDDDYKTPVRVETKVPIGKVVAVLVSQESE